MSFSASISQSTALKLLLLAILLIAPTPSPGTPTATATPCISDISFRALNSGKVGDWVRSLETFPESPDPMTQISREVIVSKSKTSAMCKIEYPPSKLFPEPQLLEVHLDIPVKPVILPGDHVRTGIAFLNGTKLSCQIITRRDPQRRENGKTLSRELELWISDQIPVTGIYLHRQWEITHHPNGSETRRPTFTIQVIEIGHDDLPSPKTR